MKLDDACRPRLIRKINVQTPLVVPSFSSVILDNTFWSDVYPKLSELVKEAALFSAYDLHLKKMAQKDIWISDVVFIDSGNYEVGHIKGVVNQFQESIDGRAKDWTFQMYAKVVGSLRPPSFRKGILVNYDKIKSLDAQISDASAFFARHDRFASCFLSKPSDESSNRLNIESLVRNVGLIADQFDVLGVTEKELGDSLLNRCTNLLRLRNALNSQRSDLPIHVFGCLDPLGIACYFLCGADIFDGTLWLKFGYHKNAAFYINNYALMKGRWDQSDGGVQIISSISNLLDLRNLTNRMRRYAQNHEDALEFDPAVMKEIENLTKTAVSGVR